MMDPAREAAVWARVRGEQPQAQPQEPTASPWSAETAAALYQAEAAAAYTYQRLAGRCRGSLRRSLLGLAQEAAAQRRSLEAVVYLLQGTRPPQPRQEPCGGLAAALRDAFQREASGAEEAFALAPQAGIHGETICRLGKSREGRAKALFCLVRSVL